jgi:hypothetical protein
MLVPRPRIIISGMLGPSSTLAAVPMPSLPLNDCLPEVVADTFVIVDEELERVEEVGRVESLEQLEKLAKVVARTCR